ncbi:MAG: ATP-binding cassette domain-containing protein, partial [Proteobacteria bacterium]
GRTGSGKSSLLQSLLRMVFVRSGSIFIEGQSIYEGDVHAHRRRFGVVPQSPYLFEGTIRSNLDRTSEQTDELLIEALRKVGLGLPLETKINEGGTQLSLGERQLICLARVLAAGRPIILMDEPTSGLDPATDAQMIRVLREAFQDRTVITIAHRLESLKNYDRVVELRDGRLLEIHTPQSYIAAMSH